MYPCHVVGQLDRVHKLLARTRQELDHTNWWTGFAKYTIDHSAGIGWTNSRLPQANIAHQRWEAEQVSTGRDEVEEG